MTARKLIYVKWIDSTTTRGWRDPSDIGEPAKIESVGWLVKETKTAVSISAHLGVDPTSHDHCDVMTIPKGAITSCRVVKLRSK